MIQYIDNESIFDTRCDVIVNSVNCVGVMGKGIAKEFKERCPKMYDDYRNACKLGQLQPGKFHWFCIDSLFNKGPKWILNFPSKLDWKKPSKYDYIILGFESLIHDISVDKTHRMKSFAFPLLGCGIGGLDPECIKGLFVKYFEHQDNIDIKLYINTTKKHEN